MTTPSPAGACPQCSADRVPDALFCEECGHDFAQLGPSPAPAGTPSGETQLRQVPAAPVTAEAGQESPLDVGWTGAATKEPARPGPVGTPGAECPSCDGRFVDGYCDQCGSKEPDPRNHFAEEPAPWVAGVCDIGIRHTRNEDAMALTAAPTPLESAVLVVCDGVSRATDSHVASLAACRAARDVLATPIPRGMGLRPAILGAIEHQLSEAVQAARAAVVETTSDAHAPNPPSCTFVAAVVDAGTAVVGNVGDSRAYWLPDATTSPSRQLTTDDSFAAERMKGGESRKDAESGPNAHAITRWLGIDSPDDLTPHLAIVDLDEDGWLLVCSDGLWNYCSDASELRDLVATTAAGLGPAGLHPRSLAAALVDYANGQGGADNITVALARVGAVAPAPTAPDAPPTPAPASDQTAPPPPHPQPEAPPPAPPPPPDPPSAPPPPPDLLAAPPPPPDPTISADPSGEDA